MPTWTTDVLQLVIWMIITHKSIYEMDEWLFLAEYGEW